MSLKVLKGVVKVFLGRVLYLSSLQVFKGIEELKISFLSTGSEGVQKPFLSICAMKRVLQFFCSVAFTHIVL